MENPRLIYGIWSSQFFTETRIRVIQNGETRLWTNVKFVQHLTQFKNEDNLKEWSMIWTMLILFPQTSILLVMKLCCMCLRRSQREEARQWDMFPEPTELLLIGCLIESIWTPKSESSTFDTKNQLADMLTKGNFTRDEWNHLLCLFNISHFSSTTCSEVLSKRTRKDSGEERVTAKPKPMMNLVSRCSVRNPDVLASTALQSPGKTRHESQLPLSSWNEQQPRTGRTVLDAYSSNYSEWNADKNWSSQEWKSDELMEVRTGRPVYDHPVCAQSTRTDLLLMTMIWTLDTDAESDMSLKSRSFLHRVNDRVRKISDQSSKDAMQDSNKHSLIWRMFMSSTLEASVFIQNYREQSHDETDVRHIWKVDRFTEWLQLTGKILHGNIYLWLVMKKSSVSRTQRFTYFQILCYALERRTRTHNQILSGKTSWRGTIQSFGHKWWWAHGVRVEYLPRIHHIAVCPWSPRVLVKNERRARSIYRTDHLHVNV